MNRTTNPMSTNEVQRCKSDNFSAFSQFTRVHIVYDTTNPMGVI